MFRELKPNIMLSLSTTIIAQSVITLTLLLACKLKTAETNRYAEGLVYYESIVKREQIQLTDYDLIALMAIFEPEIKDLNK